MLAVGKVLVVKLIDAATLKGCLFVFTTHLSFAHSLLPCCFAATFFVLPLAVFFAETLLPVVFVLACLLLPVVFIQLVATRKGTIVFLLFVQPFAFALFIFNTPVTTALQVFTLPVVVLLHIANRPFCLEAGIVNILLVLDAHNFSDAVALNLILRKGILKGCHFVVLNEATLLEVEECFVFFLLALRFAQALLSTEHEVECFHFIVVKQSVLIDLHQGVAQVFCVSSLVDCLLVGFNSQTVAELARALQVTQFLFGAIKFALYLAEAFKLGIAVCNLQHAHAFNAVQLHVNLLLNLCLKVVDYFKRESSLLVVNIAQRHLEQVLNTRIELLEEHVGGERTLVCKVVCCYGMHVVHFHLE